MSLKSKLRYGVVLQTSTVPELCEPGRTITTRPTDPEGFGQRQHRMTQFNMIGAWNPPARAAFRAAIDRR